MTGGYTMAKETRKPLTDDEKAKKEQEKKQRFVKLATLRVKKAIKAIQLLSNCTGSGYSSTPEQKKAVVEAICTATSNMVDKYEGTVEEGILFELPS